MCSAPLLLVVSSYTLPALYTQTKPYSDFLWCDVVQNDPGKWPRSHTNPLGERDTCVCLVTSQMAQQPNAAASCREASTGVGSYFPEQLRRQTCSGKQPCAALYLLPRAALWHSPGCSEKQLHRCFLGWPCRVHLAAPRSSQSAWPVQQATSPLLLGVTRHILKARSPLLRGEGQLFDAMLGHSGKWVLSQKLLSEAMRSNSVAGGQASLLVLTQPRGICPPPLLSDLLLPNCNSF